MIRRSFTACQSCWRPGNGGRFLPGTAPRLPGSREPDRVRPRPAIQLDHGFETWSATVLEDGRLKRRVVVRLFANGCFGAPTFADRPSRLGHELPDGFYTTIILLMGATATRWARASWSTTFPWWLRLWAGLPSRPGIGLDGPLILTSSPSICSRCSSSFCSAARPRRNNTYRDPRPRRSAAPVASILARVALALRGKMDAFNHRARTPAEFQGRPVVQLAHALYAATPGSAKSVTPGDAIDVGQPGGRQMAPELTSPALTMAFRGFDPEEDAHSPNCFRTQVLRTKASGVPPVRRVRRTHPRPVPQWAIKPFWITEHSRSATR